MRFGYDGAAFHGWARQPGARTVEGEIRRGLVRLAIAGSASSRLEVASRTDRAVSARSNALTLVSRLAGPELLRRLNAIDPDLYFTAAATVPSDFRVRRAIRRSYRYFDPFPVKDPPRRAEAAALFRGEIDVRSFGRGVPGAVPSWRPIESVTPNPVAGGSTIEVRAPAFVWGMVRKIVGALREVDAGRLSVVRLRAALSGRARLTLPMAEPEPLILWEVEHGVPWEFLRTDASRAQRAHARARRAEWWVRGRLLESLAETEDPGTGTS